MNRFVCFAKKEAVFCIAALCAIAALCIKMPGSAAECAGFIDVRIIGLLFSLMTAVAGLRRLGVFDAAARCVSRRVVSPAQAVTVLWLMCFVSSVFITNDVALLTFVPLAAAVLTMLNAERWLLYTVVLQTAAANLGSLLTPMGNPQNLYLYSRYQIPADVFFSITVPLFLVSCGLLVLLTVPVYVISRKSSAAGGSGGGLSANDGGCDADVRLGCSAAGGGADVRRCGSVSRTAKEKLLCCGYAVLSAVAVLSVFRLIPWYYAALCAAFILVAADRTTARDVDWFLLLTFCLFFIFSGTIASIDSVRVWLSAVIAGNEKTAAICISQVISNVPAALLLSTFTNDGAALVRGTNIGGLGTIVASLASLISYKLYCARPGAKPGKYMAVFTVVNVVLLAALCLFDYVYVQ